MQKTVKKEKETDERESQAVKGIDNEIKEREQK
jgi:hypothetical protein